MCVSISIFRVSSIFLGLGYSNRAGLGELEMVLDGYIVLIHRRYPFNNIITLLYCTI